MNGLGWIEMNNWLEKDISKSIPGSFEIVPMNKSEGVKVNRQNWMGMKNNKNQTVWVIEINWMPWASHVSDSVGQSVKLLYYF